MTSTLVFGEGGGELNEKKLLLEHTYKFLNTLSSKLSLKILKIFVTLYKLR